MILGKRKVIILHNTKLSYWFSSINHNTNKTILKLNYSIFKFIIFNERGFKRKRDSISSSYTEDGNGILQMRKI